MSVLEVYVSPLEVAACLTGVFLSVVSAYTHTCMSVLEVFVLETDCLTGVYCRGV